MKEFKVEFWRGTGPAGNEPFSPVQALQRAIDLHLPVRDFLGHRIQLRDVVALPDGAGFRGVLAKLRSDAPPHIGDVAGQERPIELADGEALLEKNSFLLLTHHQLLVYQKNWYGCAPKALGHYLTNTVGRTITFDPVLRHNEMQRLIAGNARTKSIEFSFARPGPAALDAARHEMSRDLIDMLTRTGGKKAYFRIRPQRKGFLNMDAAGIFERLTNDLNPKSAKIHLETDGVEHVVDLIADRLIGAVSVNMINKYPEPEGMFRALQQCHADHVDELNAILG